ncbi:Na+/H+ antiporter NhaA [Dongia sp.]|uniref:Na+/H+ antiporter NhaA n=1 Tax=Dongia sp. TaxID=1977262 RepID=UPI0035AFF617
MNPIKQFLQLESSGGILLLIASALAMLCSNSALAPFYQGFLDIPFGVTLGPLSLVKPLLLWINDGLMAVFFFLVGLEIKREIVGGELSSPAQAALPGIAALGGMAMPALVYYFINRSSPEFLGGWAIPAATDIAFAVAVLTLLGSRVPQSLKIFLLALAIIDDLGAIIIIAIFYTSDLSLVSLGLAAIGLAGLFVLNIMRIERITPYVLIGIFIWVCVLKSGVHATLAGVAVAFFIPYRTKSGDVAAAPLSRAEHGLHPWVSFGVMPIFAFANAGVSLAGLTLETLLHPLTLGIALGLFLGKQAGVLIAVIAGTALRLCRRPAGAGWMQIYGVALLTGIGFTMSLFIGGLAFPDPALAAEIRLGVIGGSLASAFAGYLVLRLSAASPASAPQA